MNGKQKRQPFIWSIDDYNEFFLKAELNVLDWDGKKALESLNKVCEAKHTGPNDAESILWPTVEVIVLSKLQEIGVSNHYFFFMMYLPHNIVLDIYGISS